MKATVHEYGGCFSIDLEAETLEDAAFLTRMGLNATRELRSRYACVSGEGKFSTSITFGKAKRASSEIVRRRG